jgi:DNA-binding YbaB/EbfC family protein
MLGALKDMGKIQDEIKAATEGLGDQKFDGSSGGEMVKVTANGHQQLVSCTIDPQLIEEKDKEMIEELIVAAVNEAIEKARSHAAGVVQKTLGERFNLPGMEDMLKNFLPK